MTAQDNPTVHLPRLDGSVPTHDAQTRPGKTLAMCGRNVPDARLAGSEPTKRGQEKIVCNMCERSLQKRRGLARKNNQHKASPRQWTQDELDLIRSRFQQDKRSIKELAKTLQASPPQIAYQVNKMGIRKRTDRRPWTLEEDAMLRGLMPRKTPSKVAKLMSRSINSVTIRAKRLGLKGNDREGWYTLIEVSEILGRDPKWLLKRIENGSLKANRHHGQEKLQVGRRDWHVEQKDLKDFIRKYPEELTGRNVDQIQIVEILAGIISPER